MVEGSALYRQVIVSCTYTNCDRREFASATNRPVESSELRLSTWEMRGNIMLVKRECLQLGHLRVQPLLQSVLFILDPFGDDYKRSQSFFIVGSGCHKGALVLLVGVLQDKLPQ